MNWHKLSDKFPDKHQEILLTDGSWVIPARESEGEILSRKDLFEFYEREVRKENYSRWYWTYLYDIGQYFRKYHNDGKVWDYLKQEYVPGECVRIVFYEEFWKPKEDPARIIAKKREEQYKDKCPFGKMCWHYNKDLQHD